MSTTRLDSILRRQRRSQLHDVLFAGAVTAAIAGAIALGWPS